MFQIHHSHFISIFQFIHCVVDDCRCLPTGDCSFFFYRNSNKIEIDYTITYYEHFAERKKIAFRY